MRKLYVFILIISLSVALSACSDDSSGPETGTDDIGDTTFSVSGDVDSNHAGQADFWGLDGDYGLNTWEISMHDFNPQTFNLSFMLSSTSPISRPEPGTYDINDADGFTVIYEYIENQDYANAKEYSNVLWLCSETNPSNGTLTISSSSDSEVRGTFNVSLSSVDIDDSGNCVDMGSVNITGEFRATERIPLF